MPSDWIHEQYQKLVEEFRPQVNGAILKTDCWQEWNDHNPIQADAYLEIRPDRVRDTRAKGYNVFQGTILELPCKDNTYGMIVDTSTIDHLKDYESVLKEYNRALNKDGICLVIYWSNIYDKDIVEGESWGDPQYYFSQQMFREVFNKYFFILKEGDMMLDISHDKRLMFLVGKK